MDDQNKLDTTIPGGAYQDENGSWHDANGNALTKEQIAAFKRLRNKQADAQPDDEPAQPEPIRPVARRNVKLGEEKPSDLPKPSAE
jgi:hypothetical protein